MYCAPDSADHVLKVAFAAIGVTSSRPRAHRQRPILERVLPDDGQYCAPTAPITCSRSILPDGALPMPSACACYRRAALATAGARAEPAPTTPAPTTPAPTPAPSPAGARASSSTASPTTHTCPSRFLRRAVASHSPTPAPTASPPADDAAGYGRRRGADARARRRRRRRRYSAGRGGRDGGKPAQPPRRRAARLVRHAPPALPQQELLVRRRATSAPPERAGAAAAARVSSSTARPDAAVASHGDGHRGEALEDGGRRLDDSASATPGPAAPAAGHLWTACASWSRDGGPLLPRAGFGPFRVSADCDGGSDAIPDGLSARRPHPRRPPRRRSRWLYRRHPSTAAAPPSGTWQMWCDSLVSTALTLTELHPSAAPSLSPSLTAVQASWYECSAEEYDIDYNPGNDLASVAASSSSECCDECANVNGCVAYTYRYGTCWLKSSSAGRTYASGAVSAPPFGLRRRRMSAQRRSMTSCMTTEMTWQRRGEQLLRVLRRVCQGQRLRGVHLVRLSRGTCWLKSSTAGREYLSGRVSATYSAGCRADARSDHDIDVGVRPRSDVRVARGYVGDVALRPARRRWRRIAHARRAGGGSWRLGVPDAVIKEAAHVRHMRRREQRRASAESYFGCTDDDAGSTYGAILGGYSSNQCGNYDDDDFSSDDMCCDCGGGFRPAGG